MTKLRYGITNTYYINGLLFDTDMPDTMPQLFRALKQHDIPFQSIRYVLASHYHPDHIGLVSTLTEMGVTLIAAEHQRSYIHFADPIFRRQYGERYRPIDQSIALFITPENSRAFLKDIGINGEIIPTASHSADGLALLLDDGDCFVGDLEPQSYLGAYENNTALEADWQAITAHNPRVIHFGHAPEQYL